MGDLLFFGDARHGDAGAAVVGNVSGGARRRRRVRPGASPVRLLRPGESGRGAGAGLGRHGSPRTAGNRGGDRDRVVRDAGGVVVVGGDLALVPAAIVLERVENVLTVRVDEVGPRLPQRMNDVVDETDLRQQPHRPQFRRLKAKFHYGSWFGAGSEHVRS